MPVPSLVSASVSEPASVLAPRRPRCWVNWRAQTARRLPMKPSSGSLLATGFDRQGPAYQLGLIEALSRGARRGGTGGQAFVRSASSGHRQSKIAIPCLLDREECQEFAIGSIAAVLGHEYALIDAHPTRVRLPDEPLMLVDRIVSIEGEPRSLTAGRIVTEHDIQTGDWYLDAGKIPPSIAIESGQADLFLSGYLGIDFVTKGMAVYRLLDATVTFHRELPGPEQVIRYDIRITRFFRQGDTHLFRFEFDGTVGGEPLLTMRDGCAGFFSAEELSAGKGIVPRHLDSRPRGGEAVGLDRPRAARAADNEGASGEALRRGDLAGAFGPPFDALSLADPLPLPGGRMTLVQRVETLDPAGGRFGLGLIRAEADVHPDDWFMVCHFVDDHVMPGTLMYECCLHTLRIFLMRLGWVGPSGRVAFEPLPGRGQPVAVPGAGDRVDPQGRLRGRHQRAGLRSRTVRDRRCAHVRRRQADRGDHRHGAAACGHEPARA